MVGYLYNIDATITLLSVSSQDICYCSTQGSQSIWNLVWWFLKRLEIDLNVIQLYNFWACTRRTLHPSTEIHAHSVTLFTIARKQKPPRCPSTNEWKMKMWYVCTMKNHTILKKNETKIILSGIPQIQKDKLHVFFLTHGCQLWVFRCVYLNLSTHGSQEIVRCHELSRGREIECHVQRRNGQ